MSAVTDQNWVLIREDMDLHVFFFLGLDGLAKCSQVNRGWKRLASQDFIWSQLFSNVAKDKASLKKNAITSNREIYDYALDFFNQIPQNGTGTFESLFYCNPKYSLTISLTDEANLSPPKKYTCIFTKKLPDTNSLAKCDSNGQIGTFSGSVKSVLPADDVVLGRNINYLQLQLVRDISQQFERIVPSEDRGGRSRCCLYVTAAVAVSLFGIVFRYCG